MSTIAAAPPKGISVDKPQGLAMLIHSPAVAAALLGGVITLVGAFVGPMVAQKVQNHEKGLEVKTTLATDMSKSFTMAVGAGQRVASGLIYGPTGDPDKNAAVVQGAYNAGLGRWQVDGGRITAELSARYTGKGNNIVQEWTRYRRAVTRFYRLSALLLPHDRLSFVQDIRSYFKHMKKQPWARSALPRKVNWAALEKVKGFRSTLGYRRTYDQLSSAFLSLGDTFVEQVLKLQPEV
jgi:hypothetical protein